MKRPVVLVLAGIGYLLASPARAESYVEQAQAAIVPWSGYWWPLQAGGLVGPLSRYDQATGHQAVAWERAHRPMGPSVPEWFGFCHAWAASAIMEPEPQQTRSWPDGRGQAVTLSVGDQKGMLAACHTDDVAHSYGQRFQEGDSPEAFQDLAPDALWRVLKLYVGSHRVPLVVDIEPGPEVWNFPVYAYEVRSDGWADGPHSAVLTLWLTDNSVAPDHVGCQVRRVSYTFRYTMRDGAVVLGSGRWTGHSQQDHPDFVWFPYLAHSDNPHVEQGAVRQLVGQSAPSPASPPPVVPPEATARPQPLPGPGDPQQRPVLTPLEVAALVANRTSSFPLDVTVDRFDSGTYRPGEPISVRVNSDRAGFLYLFYLDHQGNLTLLYPRAGHLGRIEAHTPTDIPGANEDFVFRVSTSPGVHRIKAIVTTRPIMLGGLVLGPAQQHPRQGEAPAGELRRGQQISGQTSAPYPKAEAPAQVSRGKVAPAVQRARPAPSRGAVIQQAFRWPPAQRAQVQAILGPYVAQNVAQKVPDVDPHQLLGPFAQDEVLFVVEPAPLPIQHNRGPKPSATSHNIQGPPLTRLVD